MPIEEEDDGVGRRQPPAVLLPAQQLQPMAAPAERSRKRTKAGVYTSSVTFESLASVFHLPSNQACEALGVGLTIFKRLCRKFGLQRWPYRTLKKQGKLAGHASLSSEDMQLILQSCRDPSAPPQPLPQGWQPGSMAAGVAHPQPAARSGSASLSGGDASEAEAGESNAGAGGGRGAVLRPALPPPLQPLLQAGSPTARSGPPRRAKAAAALLWAEGQDAGSAGNVRAATAAATAAAAAGTAGHGSVLGAGVAAAGTVADWRGDSRQQGTGSPSSSGRCTELGSRGSTEHPAKRHCGAAAASAPPAAVLHGLNSQLGTRLELLLSAMQGQAGRGASSGLLPDPLQPAGWLLPTPTSAADDEQPSPRLQPSPRVQPEQQPQQHETVQGKEAEALPGVIRPLPTRAVPSASDPLQLERILVADAAAAAAAGPSKAPPALGLGWPTDTQVVDTHTAAALLSPFSTAVEKDPEKVAALLKQLANVFDHQSKIVAAAAKAKRQQQQQSQTQQAAEQRGGAAAAATAVAALEQASATAAGQLPAGVRAGAGGGAFPLGSLMPLLWAAGPPVQPPQLPEAPQLTGVTGQPARSSSSADGGCSSLQPIKFTACHSDPLPLTLAGRGSSLSLLQPPTFGINSPEHHMQALMSSLGSLCSEGSRLSACSSLSLPSGNSSLSLPLPPHVMDQLAVSALRRQPRAHAQPFK